MSREARIKAFLTSPTDVFETIEHRHEIWREDPFDVPSIHSEARTRFRELLGAATAQGGAPGRVLVLRGESGSGKTHLLRALRAMAHKERAGFVGYMQLTSLTHRYPRYLLSNLIDSLDQPYDETLDPRSGLVRISTALASRAFEPQLASMLRDDENLEHDEVTDLVYTGADRLIAQRPFQFADIDLLRAFLYLYRPNPALRARVIKYLRCERLSAHDSKMLGELSPRDSDEDPERVVELIGRLLSVLTDNPLSLVVCLDQLEGMHEVDTTDAPLLRALTTITDLACRLPSSIFVVSCLVDSYMAIRNKLKQSTIDRLEQETPIDLRARRPPSEATSIVRERLRYLYATSNVSFDENAPLDPFPADFISRQQLWRTREIIEVCRRHRKQCKDAKALVPFVLHETAIPDENVEKRRGIEHWERAWNDALASEQVTIPDSEEPILSLLSWAIDSAGEELETGHRFPARVEDGGVVVEATLGGQSREHLLVALCNRPAQFGHLANQIGKLAKQVKSDPKKPVLVLVRLDEFPHAQSVSKEIRAVAKEGGRSVAVPDADLRAMIQLRRFLEKHRNEPHFDAWFRLENHMSRLSSIRRILDLDALDRFAQNPVSRPSVTNGVQPPPASGNEPAATPEPPKEGDLALGATRGLMQRPVTLAPELLTRHAAFLGGTGSGKTTLALTMVEQLLLRGIPVTMIDRKGDLAGYARPRMWHSTDGDPRMASLRESLARRADVQLFTPGHPGGRPLAIGVIPEGVGELGPFERNEAVAQAAQALADMLNYKNTGRDAALRAILIQALQVLTEALDRPVTLDAVVELIAEEDPLLVSRVGRLDTKLFEQLVRDVETLNLTATNLFGAGAERLDPDLLFGRGRFAKPGKTRLSVISTKFLRNDAEVLFWVAHLLFTVLRWGSKNPKESLQAAILFDEADMYLPALRQPVTKAPMESLLKRGRSAGLSVFLATQSPGDLDYRCRDNVRTWFLGRIKEPTALQKLKPMAGDVVDKLAGQSTGEFYLVDEKGAAPFSAQRSFLKTDQVPEDEMLDLARDSAARERSR